MHSISQRAVNWVRGLIAATVLVICSHEALFAAPESPGIAVVTSRSGDALIDGRKLKLHEQLTLTGAELQTGANSTLFVVLSNGVAISLGPNTTLEVQQYTQKPFPPKKQSQQYEPSESKLLLNLSQGSLCCSFEHLSPISEARIETPHGQLRIHSGTNILLVDNTQTQINIFSGTATFYYPAENGRAFISESQSIVINAASAHAGKITSTQSIEQVDTTYHQLAEATHYARSRIAFQGSDDGRSPTPIFILPMDFYDKSPTRPYQFKQRLQR